MDDAVFRLTATFPIRPLRQHVYKLRGDSLSGFDPNAFVEKLIEETGISHTWEPVLAKIPEGGGCTYMKVRISARAVPRGSLESQDGQGPLVPKAGEDDLKKFMVPSEREAKHDARELLWAVWSKCQPVNGELLPGSSDFTGNRAAKLRKWAESHFRTHPMAVKR